MKKWVTVSLIVVLCIVISSFFITRIFYNNKSADNIKDDNKNSYTSENIKLTINIYSNSINNNDFSFVGEMVYFNLSNAPKDLTYNWNFGDGSEKEGYSVTNSYDYSGYFNVSVSCGFEGKEYSSYTILPVRNQDRTWGFINNIREIDLEPNGSDTEHFKQQILDGITYPDIEFYLNISNAYGDIELNVYISNPDQGDEDLIYSYKNNYKNEDVIIYRYLTSNLLKGMKLPYKIIFEIVLDHGYYRSSSLLLNAYY